MLNRFLCCFKTQINYNSLEITNSEPQEEVEENSKPVDYTKFFPEALIKRAPLEKIAKMVYYTNLIEYKKEIDDLNLEYIETEGYKIPYLVFNPFYKKTIVISHGRSSILFLFEILKKISSEIDVRIIIYQHPSYYLSVGTSKLPSQKQWNDGLRIVCDFFRPQSTKFGIIGLSIGCSSVCDYLVSNPNSSEITVSFCSLVKSLPEMVSENPNLKLKLIDHLYETTDKLHLFENHVKVYYSVRDEFTCPQVMIEISNKIKNHCLIEIKGDHYCFNKIENLRTIINELF